MDQIVPYGSPPLNFTLVSIPVAGCGVTLVSQGNRLLGQLAWRGFSRDMQGKLTLGQHFYDGKLLYCSCGAYGEVEQYEIVPVEDFVLTALNGGKAPS